MQTFEKIITFLTDKTIRPHSTLVIPGDGATLRVTKASPFEDGPDTGSLFEVSGRNANELAEVIGLIFENAWIVKTEPT